MQSCGKAKAGCAAIRLQGHPFTCRNKGQREKKRRRTRASPKTKTTTTTQQQNSGVCVCVLAMKFIMRSLLETQAKTKSTPTPLPPRTRCVLDTAPTTGGPLKDMGWVRDGTALRACPLLHRRRLHRVIGVLVTKPVPAIARFRVQTNQPVRVGE